MNNNVQTITKSEILKLKLEVVSDIETILRMFLSSDRVFVLGVLDSLCDRYRQESGI